MKKPKFIDIHSHVQFAAFDDDREEVIKRTLKNGVWMINIGTQADTSKSAVDLANRFDGVFASVGLHPIHTSRSYHDKQELGEGGKEFTSRGENFDYELYKKLGSNKKVVAIGECGLDFYRLSEETIEKQKEAFARQIELANELGKPLMLHVRNAYDDTYDMIKNLAKVRGNVHFFAGDQKIAKKFLDLGFTISFTGVITFSYSTKQNYCDYASIIRYVPLDMIMTETDSPYVAPIPFRGKRNEPIYVEYVVKRIAEIKGLDLDAVASTIFANARRVFNL